MTEPPSLPPRKSPVDTALEAFVYAPIGLLFEGSALFPQLVDKGRQHVTMARMVGQLALKQAGDEAVKAAAKLSDQAAGVLELIGGSASPTPEPSAPPPPPPPSPRRPEPPGPAGAPAPTAVAEPPRDRPDPTELEPGLVVTSLAIPDYDGLSASQVVNRLAGLDPDELDAVRRYELANRGRKTILSKIAQLQSS